MMTASSHMPLPSSSPATRAALTSADGRTLPLLGTALRAQAAGGIARVVVEQRFRNRHDVPLAVTYSLPLPADGAVSGFSFSIGERRIVGEIDRREAARERFEAAILEGQSAALLEQDRSSLFMQEIGNIPPGAEVVASIVIDQRMTWLAEGAWEWRFPCAVAPRYSGAVGRVPDADRIAQELAIEPIPARLTLELCVRDELPPGRVVESPSHALHAASPAQIQFREAGGVPLDRDVVVRWAVATESVRSTLELARPSQTSPVAHSSYGLLTLVPPTTSQPAIARDVIVLLDTSGSMSGEPLAQACRVLSAVVDSLGEADALEMIQFSSAPRRWKRAPVSVTPALKREALDWLASRTAGGGTEMRDAIVEALRGVHTDSQRQVILVTDGFIGFEAEVVAAIAAQRSRSTRVHAVGVGSAVNRSLTSAAARAGRGLELIVGLGEDAEPAARRITAGTSTPLVVDLDLSGSAFVEHAGLPDLFSGRPALIPLGLRPEGGELVLRGRSPDGPWEQRMQVAPTANDSGRTELVALFGRERVEDLEVRVAAGETGIDAQIEQLGLDFGIATRLSSWVAVSEQPSVDPRSPSRRERMPQQLPHGVSAEALGLRSTRSAQPMLARARLSSLAPAMSAPSRTGMSAERTTLRQRMLRMTRSSEPASANPILARPDFDAEASAGEERSLRGSVLRRDQAVLVLEFEVDEALEWDAPELAWIDWSDGSTARLELDPLRSTRDSILQPGERARVVLRLDAASQGLEPAHLRLSLAGATLHVVF